MESATGRQATAVLAACSGDCFSYEGNACNTEMRSPLQREDATHRDLELKFVAGDLASKKAQRGHPAILGLAFCVEQLDARLASVRLRVLCCKSTRTPFRVRAWPSSSGSAWGLARASRRLIQPLLQSSQTLLTVAEKTCASHAWKVRSAWSSIEWLIRSFRSSWSKVRRAQCGHRCSRDILPSDPQKMQLTTTTYGARSRHQHSANLDFPRRPKAWTLRPKRYF